MKYRARNPITDVIIECDVVQTLYNAARVFSRSDRYSGQEAGYWFFYRIGGSVFHVEAF